MEAKARRGDPGDEISQHDPTASTAGDQGHEIGTQPTQLVKGPVMNDELIGKIFDKLEDLTKEVGAASGQRSVIASRLEGIESEIARLRVRCETRCESYSEAIQSIKVVLATHKGIIWTVSGVISAAVAFTTAWIKSR